jgi:Rrf2 family transcriptional regulator, nitric oxide-sensitive transcriptional repressor
MSEMSDGLSNSIDALPPREGFTAGRPYKACALSAHPASVKVVSQMQLSRFTDYALRVLIYAAARPDARCLTTDVATAFRISRHHLVKVVNELQHLGYLETIRGREGGFVLARPPARIRIGDVIRSTEGTMALVECFDRGTNTCPLAPACGLKGVLSEAFEAFLAVLDRHSLADLVAEPRWVARVSALQPVRARGGLSHSTSRSLGNLHGPE